VLVLCTGNICRSPMAEVLLADELGRRGVEAAVHSAGLLEDGRPASEHSVTLMAERGLDLSAHASRVMTPTMLEGADLILGMERRHIREAAVLVPACWRRAFTLRELARLVTAAGPRPVAIPLGDWLDTLVAGRTPAAHLGESADDEVADPIGRSLRTYRKCAEALDELGATVVAHLWPPADEAVSPTSLRSTIA
jgi:protein-tyrosine phosphatase